MPRVTSTKVQKLFKSLISLKTLKEPVQLDTINVMRPIRGTRGKRVRWSTPVWNYIWDEKMSRLVKKIWICLQALLNFGIVSVQATCNIFADQFLTRSFMYSISDERMNNYKYQPVIKGSTGPGVWVTGPEIQICPTGPAGSDLIRTITIKHFTC